MKIEIMNVQVGEYYKARMRKGIDRSKMVRNTFLPLTIPKNTIVFVEIVPLYATEKKVKICTTRVEDKDRTDMIAAYLPLDYLKNLELIEPFYCVY